MNMDLSWIFFSKRREEAEVLFGGFNMKYSSKEVCFFLTCVLDKKSSIDTGSLTKIYSEQKNLSRQKPETKSKENNSNKASAQNLICCKFRCHRLLLGSLLCLQIHSPVSPIELLHNFHRGGRTILQSESECLDFPMLS